MNRRSFLKRSSLVGAGLIFGPRIAESASSSALNLKTKHLILIVNGNGARKKEYYEDTTIAPNISKMAKEGYVFEEDHCNQVSSHAQGFTELLTGIESQTGVPLHPSILHYIRAAYSDEATKYWHIQPTSDFRQHQYFHEKTRPLSFTTQNLLCGDKNRSLKNPNQIVAEQFPDIGLTVPEKRRLEDFISGLQSSDARNPNLGKPFPPRSAIAEEGQSLRLIPKIMAEFKPRVLILQQAAHDTGHGSGGHFRHETGHDEYLRVAKATDESLGYIMNWVKNDTYFGSNTAVVVRPEFGRDDEINRYGEIHHSEGYYYAHRVATIFWGPDFKTGVDKTTVINRVDTCPTLTRLFNVTADHAAGQVVPGLFKREAGILPRYKPNVD